jgi:isopentenyl-diphosphate delta-isomerase
MKLIKINKQDKPIGTIDKTKAHKGKGILHRAFSVFVVRPVVANFNLRQKQERRMNSAITKNYQILLQKRSKYKLLWPGFWTNTCCSHAKSAKSGNAKNAKKNLKKQAEQRLKQEMGLTVPLKKVGTLYYQADYKDKGTEHELTHIFIGKYTNQPINPDPKEVADYKWMSIKDLKKDIKDNPAIYTPWLKKILSNSGLESAILADYAGVKPSILGQ